MSLSAHPQNIIISIIISEVFFTSTRTFYHFSFHCFSLMSQILKAGLQAHCFKQPETKNLASGLIRELLGLQLGYSCYCSCTKFMTSCHFYLYYLTPNDQRIIECSFKFVLVFSICHRRLNIFRLYSYPHDMTPTENPNKLKQTLSF